jgi:predicted DNA-binding transcriptional regulator AlpA
MIILWTVTGKGSPIVTEEEKREYLTLDESAKSVGLKRPSLYFYINKLGIERHKFPLNRHIYLARADVERIRAAKEHPWTIDDEAA